MCVTDRHDITVAVKVALNPNTTNQPTNHQSKIERRIKRATRESYKPLQSWTQSLKELVAGSIPGSAKILLGDW